MQYQEVGVPIINPTNYYQAQATTALDEAEEQGKLTAEAELKLEKERIQHKEEVSELRVCQISMNY